MTIRVALDDNGDPYYWDDGLPDDGGDDPLRLRIGPEQFKPGPIGERNTLTGLDRVLSSDPGTSPRSIGGDASFEPPRSYEDITPEPIERLPESVPGPHNTLYGPPSPEPTWEDAIGNLTRPTRQMVKGVAETALGVPWDLAALLTDASPMLPIVSRTARSPQARDAYTQLGNYLREQAAGARRGVAGTLGVEEQPTGLVDRAYSGLGASVTPMKGATGAATGIVATGKLVGEGIKNMFAPATAQPSVTHTPTPLPPPNAAAVDSIGGPTWISQAEVATVGLLGAVSIGMAFGPRVYANLKAGAVPKLKSAGVFLDSTRLRPVKDAAPGTMAMSRPGDLARTYDDANAGVIRIMHRAKIDPVAAAQVEEVMKIQTRATANAMAQSAIDTGRMVTPAFTFQSRVALADLAKVDTPQTTQYMHALNTIEDIKFLSTTNRNMTKRPPSAGPIRVRGMTLVDADNVKRALEQTNPEVKEFAKAFAEITQAVRKFQATGEYAPLSKAQYNYLNRQRKHDVPFKGARTLGDPVERGPATEALAEHMRVVIRERLENEAKGLYVDAVRRKEPSMFVRVKPEQLKPEVEGGNPQWAKNVVEIARRGKKEQYTTDPLIADVLRMDPYYMTSIPGSILYTAKRWTEVTTTGELAPWFAATSFLRSWQIGKFTAKEGRKSSSLAGSVMAIPRQAYPQMAKAISRSLENGSGGWLNSTFGPGTTDALATRLAHHYERSLWHQLATSGGGRGSILQQQTSANNRLTKAVESATGPAKSFLEGYRTILNTIHNAPAFDYARKNFGKAPLPVIAREARDMTGDPRVGGQFANRGRAIRYENTGTDLRSRVSHTAGQALKVYGGATEFGRMAVPWYNATVQGIKRIGSAYMDNPAKFVTRAWLYQGAPAAAAYLYTRSLGKDPNGLDYSDYQVNRRSDYKKLMNIFVPIPGRPAEEGIEFPLFHEIAPMSYLTQIAMDHGFRSNIFTEGEDLRRAAGNIAGVLFDPAFPALNLAYASVGKVGSGGMFGGETYSPKDVPFDQLGGMPKSIELYARAIVPGLADMVGSGYASYTQTPEGFLNGIGNASKSVVKRGVMKTPIVRDLFNVHPPMSGNTAVVEELFARKKVLDELERYYKEWTVHQGLIGVASTKDGLVEQQGRSKEGGVMATALLGERPPAESAGLNQPKIKNPLYERFIEQLHNKIYKDAPYHTSNSYRGNKGDETGAVGFLSLMQRYSLASRHIARLRKVNDGNAVTWERELSERPDQLAYLKRNGVDPTNINRVRNFYETQRHNAARTMLFVIREIEKEFSDALGRPVKLEDIRPYGKGLEAEAGQVGEYPTGSVPLE